MKLSDTLKKRIDQDIEKTKTQRAGGLSASLKNKIDQDIAKTSQEFAKKNLDLAMERSAPTGGIKPLQKTSAGITQTQLRDLNQRQSQQRAEWFTDMQGDETTVGRAAAEAKAVASYSKLTEQQKKLDEMQAQQREIEARAAALDNGALHLQRLYDSYAANPNDVDYMAYVAAYEQHQKAVEQYNKDLETVKKNAAAYAGEYSKYTTIAQQAQRNLAEYNAAQQAYDEAHPLEFGGDPIRQKQYMSYLDREIEAAEQKLTGVNAMLGSYAASGSERAQELEAEKNQLQQRLSKLRQQKTEVFGIISGAEKAEQAAQYNSLMREADFEQFTELGKQYLASGKAPAAVGGSEAMVPVNLKLSAELNYDEMTEEEKNIYAYLLGKQGAVAAREYLSFLEENLNLRRGQKTAEAVRGMKHGVPRALASGAYAFMSGVETFGSDFATMWTGEVEPKTATQVAGELIRQDIQQDGKKVGGVLYDLLYNAANAAPSMLVGGIPGLSLLGASAAGGAKREALQAGYNRRQANAYGIMVGVSEAAMSGILGGMANLGGKLTNHAVKAAINNIDNAFLKVATKVGINMAGEGVEEYLQEILNPVYRNIFLGEENEIKAYTEEAMYAFLLGALSSAGTNVIAEGSRAAADQTVGRHIKKGSRTDEILDRALSMDGTKSQEMAQQIRAKDKKESAGNLGELVRQMFADGYTAAEFAGDIALTKPEAEQPVGVKWAGSDPDTLSMTGRLTGEEANISAEDYEQADRISKAAGREIVLYRKTAGEEGVEDGFYDRSTGKIYVNVESPKSQAHIVAHELTHSTELAESYGKLSRLVLDRIRAEGGNLRELREEKRSFYARNGIALESDTEADQEIVAEYIADHLLTDETSITELVRQDRGLAEKLVSWFDKMLAVFGNEKARERVFIQNARNLYAKALEESQGRHDRLQEIEQAREQLRKALNEGEISDAEFDEAMEAIDQQAEEYAAEGVQGSFGKSNARTYSVTKTKMMRSDTNARFSMSKAVEETKDLIAVHNLHAAELLETLKLSGLPSPSVAIIKAKDGHEKYGDVSLILPKDAIDPQANKANRIYGGDAWTPTRSNAQVEYEVDYDTKRQFERNVEQLAKGVADGIFAKSSVLDMAGIEDSTSMNLSEITRKIADYDAVKAAYVAENGGNVEIVYRTKEFDTYGNEALKSYADMVGVQEVARLTAKLMVGERLTAEELETAKDVIVDNWTAKRESTLKRKPELREARIAAFREKLNNMRVEDFVRHAWEFYEDSGATTDEIDHGKTSNNLRSAVDRSDVEAWVAEKLQGLLSEPGIYNGKDYYTPSGRRRSFGETHWEYTAENIVRAMNNADARGANVWNVSGEAVIATATPEYNSIDEVRADKGRLFSTEQKTYDQIEDDISAELEAVTKDIVRTTAHYSDNQYDEEQIIGRVIMEAAQGTKTVAGVKRVFQKNGYRISDEQAKSVLYLLDHASKVPTEYFEAKPQRVVGFDEIGVYVIPNDADARLKQELLNRGYSIAEYDPNIKGHRKQVVNQFERYKFSFGANDNYSGAARVGVASKDVDAGYKDYDVTAQVYAISTEAAEQGKDLVKIGTMPPLYRDLFGLSGSVYVSNGHLYQNIVSKEKAIEAGRYKEGDSADYHNLGEEKVINAIVQSQDPMVMMESLKDYESPRLVSIVEETGRDNDNLIVVTELYANRTAFGEKQPRNHVLITVYEKSSLPEYVKKTLEKGRVLHIKEGLSSDKLSSLQLAGSVSDEVLKRNLAQFVKKVNRFKIENKINYSVSNPAEQAKDRADEIVAALPAKARDVLGATERHLVNKLGIALSVPKYAQREFLADLVRQISGEVLETGTVRQQMLDELFETAYEQGVVVDREFYDRYKDIKDYLRTTPLQVSDQIRGDIADFDAFRRSAFGSLRMVNSGGQTADVMYMELRNMAPELFPFDIQNPSDQVLRMFEAAKSIRVSEMKLDQAYGHEAENFKRWTRVQFEADVNELLGEIRNVKRYADDKKTVEREAKLQTQAEVEEAYKELKEAKRNYERTFAKVLLTSHDEMLVGRLLRGEIEPGNLDPVTDNVDGITKVYAARKEYDRWAKKIAAWNAARKEKLRADADEMLVDPLHWRDKKAGWMYSRETMERNIRDIVPDQELAQRIIDHYFTPVHEAVAAATRMKNDYRQRVKDLNLSRKVEKGNAVSEAHAVQLLGEVMDNIRVLEANRRLKERDGKTLEEWNGVIAELWNTSPNLDRKKVESAVETFRKIYDELFKKMNDARVRNGYEPINYRQGYFPHFQPKQTGLADAFGKAMGIEMNVTALPTTINGMTHTFKPGIQWFGNAQERLGFNTAYDAVEGFDRYIEGSASVINTTDSIQRLRALESQIRFNTTTEQIRKQIMEIKQRTDISEAEKETLKKEIEDKAPYALSNFVVELDEYINLLANKKSKYDRTVEGLVGRNFYNVAKAAESRVAANMVGLNPGSWLTNFIPLTQADAALDRGMLLRGMWQTMSQIKTKDGLSEMSAFLTNRRGSDPLVRTWTQKASAVTSKPMEWIDTFVSESIVRARYLQNIKAGLSEESAMRDADAFAANVIADRSKGAMPTIFEAKNPLVKLLTQYQLEVNNQLSYLFKDLPAEAKAKKSGAIAVMLLKFGLEAWLYNEIYEFFIGRRPALDPISMLLSTAEELVGFDVPNLLELITGEDRDFSGERTGVLGAGKKLAEDIGGNTPFVGGLLFDGGRLPISSAMPNLANLVTAATDTSKSGRKRIRMVLKELEKPALYWVPPFAGGQLKKIYQGITAVIRGGSYTVDNEGNDVLQYPIYRDSIGETTWNTITAVLFGKSSTKTGREWVENEFKSFSAAETACYQGMVDAGAGERQAFEFLSELKRVQGTENESKQELQKEMLQNAQLSGAAKSVVYYSLFTAERDGIPDRKRELMDELADTADMGTVTEALLDLDAAGTARVKRNIIADAELTEDEKLTMYRYIMGSRDEETGAYQLSEDVQADLAVYDLAGLGLDQYVAALDTKEDLSDEYEDSADRELEFYRWVSDQGYTARQAEAVRGCFWSGTGTKYDEFVAAGIADRTAYKMAKALKQLTPLPGETRVTAMQKYEVVVNSGLPAAQQMSAMAEVMTAAQYKKLELAYDYSIPPAVYVEFARMVEENEAGTADEIKKLLKSLGTSTAGALQWGGGLSLTKQQKAALWQIFVSKSTEGGKNPFDRSVGRAIYELRSADE